MTGSFTKKRSDFPLAVRDKLPGRTDVWFARALSIAPALAKRFAAHTQEGAAPADVMDSVPIGLQSGRLASWRGSGIQVREALQHGGVVQTRGGSKAVMLVKRAVSFFCFASGTRTVRTLHAGAQYNVRGPQIDA